MRNLLRQIKATYAQNDSATTSELEPRSHVENFEKRLIWRGPTPDLLDVEQMGVNDTLDKLDVLGCSECVLVEDIEHEPSTFEHKVEMFHIETCPFIEATRKSSGLCLFCVKQGRLSSMPTSFCVGGVDVSEQTLMALSLKEQHSRSLLPSYSVDHSSTSSLSDISSPFKALELKRRGESDENHNCMSPTRIEHQDSRDYHT